MNTNVHISGLTHFMFANGNPSVLINAYQYQPREFMVTNSN